MSINRNIVKFNGGLGNQMFQYAFGKALQLKTGIETVFDMSFFTKKYSRPYNLNIFKLKHKNVEDLLTKIRLEILWRFRKRLNNKSFLGINLYTEPHFEYDNNLFEQKPNTYIEGFFQSEKYFKEYETEIRSDYEFKSDFEGLNKELAEKITSSNSISLHIRRGDYVQKKRYQNVYATCSLDYYKRGVEYITQREENPTLFIFSDDINWVKENLKLPYESIYVTNNTGEKSFEDMHLMSICKHNIIANSSFSWWGAWLNNNSQKIVIAPNKWFNDEKINQTDIIPETWVRIDN